MDFQEALSLHFPGAMVAGDFVRRTHETLHTWGFESSNTIACVSVCRDELTRPFRDDIQKVWGHAFNFSSLAGMLFLGKTGFLAAQHHAPNEDGRERYLYFAFPHIGIDARGEIGLCYRSGRKERSHACGALVGFQRELTSASIRLDLDADDLEQSLLKQRIFRRLTYGDVPDLVRLTRLAHEVILEELERMIQLTVDTTRSDYAVLTGVQIHGPEASDYVWPDVMYAVVDQARRPLTIPPRPPR